MGAIDRSLLRRGTLLLLLLLAFATRSSGLTAQSLWRDEVDALRFSQVPLHSLVSNFTRPGWNGPLFYVFLRFWLAFAGSSEFALRYLSLLAGVLGVAAVYRLGRAWYSRSVGAVAALLTACSPYMVWYAQEAKMYAPLCTLAVATLHVYHQALRGADWRHLFNDLRGLRRVSGTPHRHNSLLSPPALTSGRSERSLGRLSEADWPLWVAIVVLIWLTVGVHVMGALLLPVMALLPLAWWPVARKRWREALLVLAVSILPGVVALPWALPLLLRGGNIGHRFVPLPGMALTMLYALARGITTAGGLWPVGLAIFCLMAGTLLWSDGDPLSRLLVLARRDRDRVGEGAYVCATWVWLAVPVLGLYAISTRVPLFVDRYLIWIGPAFYLLVARGLDQVRRRSAILSGVCLAAIVGLNGWGIWEQSAMPIKSDFRATAAYVQQHRQPGELILFHISYVRETFEYYYGDASPTADGIPTNERTTRDAVDAAMKERTAGHEVVWLVLSEPEMWDRRGMTVAWLEAHAESDLRADFARVSVIRYRLTHAE